MEGAAQIQPFRSQRIRDGQRILRTESFRRNTGELFISIFCRQMMKIVV